MSLTFLIDHDRREELPTKITEYADAAAAYRRLRELENDQLEELNDCLQSGRPVHMEYVVIRAKSLATLKATHGRYFDGRYEVLHQTGDVLLFDEKERNYEAPSLNAESTYSFYDRSSLNEFANLRQMLNRWASHLPLDKQKDVIGRMRHKGRGEPRNEKSFNGAFLEMFLHEFLNGTGGTVTNEPKIGNLTPDFGITETNQAGKTIQYIVEATDINVLSNTELDDDWEESRALDIINEIQATDYRLAVKTEGKLRETPRGQHLKKPFLAALEKARQSSSYTATARFPEEGGFGLGNWHITGTLVRVPKEQQPRRGRFISTNPNRSGTYGEVGKVKDRLYDKAKRYRGAENLIIAIRCDPFLGDTSVAEALFGSVVIQYYQQTAPHHGQTPPPQLAQVPDGFWWNTKGPQNQHVIGVAVFQNLYPHCVDKTEVTYHANPYSDAPQPEWANAVRHTVYDPQNQEVKTVEGIPPANTSKTTCRQNTQHNGRRTASQLNNAPSPVEHPAFRQRLPPTDADAKP